MLKLGDGTEESRVRVQRAVDSLWRFVPELFATDDVDAAMQSAGVAPDLAALEPVWQGLVRDVVSRATLSLPHAAPRMAGRTGRQGAHTEALGHMLAEMQIIARSHPGAQW